MTEDEKDAAMALSIARALVRNHDKLFGDTKPKQRARLVAQLKEKERAAQCATE